ncbi:GIY-YIG nuclease family protein, partial [Pararcticibacter amylolyticus]
VGQFNPVTGRIQGSGAIEYADPTFEIALAIATGGMGNAAKGGVNVVYQGIDAAGVVRYVGITERAASVRFAEHLNAIGTGRELLRYEVIEGATDLSRTGARILEQTLINQYGLHKNGGLLLNKINSIAPKYWKLYDIK